VVNKNFSRKGGKMKKEMETIQLRKDLKRLSNAAADEQARYAFNHIFIKGGKAYATDGKRLHRLELKMNGSKKIDGWVDARVLRKQLAELTGKKQGENLKIKMRNIRKESADPEVKEKMNWTDLTIGKLNFLTEQPGMFPDAEYYFEQKDCTLKLDQREFYKAMKYFASFPVADPEVIYQYNPDKAALSFEVVEDGLMLSRRISYDSWDIGKVEYLFKCNVPKEAIGQEFAVNPQYIADALEAKGSRWVEFSFTDADTPVIVATRGINLFDAVIMPIKLR
jgi:DNA polymerase III sliding clamp (beta) subunit (PCNA family)